jgi:membrane peptidoglycan carboxypeptidase
VPKKVTRKAPQRRRVPAKRTTRFQRFLLRYGWTLPVGAILIGSGILGLTYAFASIPLPRDLDLDASAEVYDMNDRLIGTFSGEVRRFIMDTSKLPNYVGEAVVAAEDRDFYDHNGVSLRGIIRATWANVTGGEIRQGGSTITQQYVKTAILKDPSRTLSRKVKEAILAIKLERQYSKKQILGFYLNTIYLGRGAYGVKAAARTYFDKRAPNLTLGEAAYLAGIIPSPESYQPDSNPDGARARRDRVLE